MVHALDSCAGRAGRYVVPAGVDRRPGRRRRARPGAGACRWWPTSATSTRCTGPRTPRSSAHGSLDVVVAGAAVMAGGAPLWETDPADLRLLWETDALGVWNTAHATVPHLLALDARARVRRRRLRGRRARPVPPRGVLHGQARRGRDRPRAGRRPGRHRGDRLRRLPGSTDTAMLRGDRRASTASTSPSSPRRRAPAVPSTPTRSRPSWSSAATAGTVVHGSVLHADGGFRGMSTPPLPSGFTVRLARRHPGLRRRPHARRRLRGGAAPATPGPGDAARTGTAGGPRRRLLDRRRGCCSTAASPTRGGPRPARRRASPTSPSWSRCATGPGSSPGCWPSLPPSLPVLVVDDGSADPGPPARSPRSSAPGCCGTGSAVGPAAARNTGLAAVRTAARRVPRLRRGAGAGLARARCAGTSTTRPSASSGPGCSAACPRPGDGWLCRYEAARSSLDLGPRPGAGAAPGPGRLPPERGAARPPVGGAGSTGAGFDERHARSPRTSTWCGGCTPPAGGCATSRRPPYATTTGPTLRPWLRRKAYYGTGAAPLADRHGSRRGAAGADPVDDGADRGGARPAALVAAGRRRWSCVGVTASIGPQARTPSDRPVRTAASLTALGAVSVAAAGRRPR